MKVLTYLAASIAISVILLIILIAVLIHNHHQRQAANKQADLLKSIRTRLVKQTLAKQQQDILITKLQTQNDGFKDRLRKGTPHPVRVPQNRRINANSRAIFRSYVVGLDYYQKEFEAALADASRRGYFKPYDDYDEGGLKADYLYAKKYRVDADANIGEIQLVEEVDGADRSVRVELKVAEHGYVIGYLPKKQVNEAFNVIDIYANSVLTLSSKTNLTGGEWKMAIDAVDEMQYMTDPNAQNRALPDYGSIDTPLQIKTGKKSYFLQFTLYEMQIANDQIPMYSLVDTIDGQRGSIIAIEAGPISYVIEVEAGSDVGAKISVIPEQIARVIWVPNWK
ncbi:hypothetical protein [Lactiplantibacillus fabifermentans]|uniref:Extracellular protein, membrane-anchored n=2 Tax=Lactiplantibacillus fabifermentans TaxID=483011 RepID=A0A0R2NQ28_9LACO|nr:hypothetical protein [Lactiplantibacillus fabifermentans]ETY74058.1 membrane protein [Lactiplantibacillus fabifermentans T30PCM01]KRO26827.1 hypothetical protein DY78_GL000600 [Lactiplantibacillus fabifermentans DSM 21115]